MGKIIFSALLGSLLALPLAAQARPQAPPKDLSSWLRNSYAMNRKFIARTAEKMPEEFYGMRPGAQPEVRTFGQLIGHLANFNYRWCSDAKGEKNPVEETDFEKLAAKADLVKALNSALTYCDSAYAMLTDTNSKDLVQGTRDDALDPHVRDEIAVVLVVVRQIRDEPADSQHGNLRAIVPCALHHVHGIGICQHGIRAVAIG